MLLPKKLLFTSLALFGFGFVACSEDEDENVVGPYEACSVIGATTCADGILYTCSARGAGHRDEWISFNCSNDTFCKTFNDKSGCFKPCTEAESVDNAYCKKLDDGYYIVIAE